MVKFSTLDAATANVTNTTFAHHFDLVDRPFGLQELESVLSFPARDGASRTLTIQTSDLAAVIFAILVSTFAIDRYLFKSRYLVDIGGASRKDKDHAAALDEKGARDVESGQQRPIDLDDVRSSTSELKAGSQAPMTRSGWARRAWQNAIVLSLFGFGLAASINDARAMIDVRAERRSTKAEGRGKRAELPPTSRWGKYVQHPWTRKIGRSAMLLVVLLFMLLSSGHYLLFWPFFLLYFIAIQCIIHENLSHPATIPSPADALKSTLHIAVGTIVGATLVLKPNRFQGTFWKCFKWTHAVTCWLFWAIFESYGLGGYVARWTGLYIPGFPTTKLILFVMRPALVVYLYSGVVCNAIVMVRVVQQLWNYDVTK